MESTRFTLPIFLPQGQELFRAEPAGVAELRHVLDKVGPARASGWVRITMPGYTGTLLLVRGAPVAAALEQDSRPDPQYGAEAYDATVALLRLGAGLVLVRLDERTARAAAGLFGPPSHSRWLSSPLAEARLALELLGGARFSGAVELLPRENAQTARAVVLMHTGRVLGIYDVEAPIPQPSLDGQVAAILAQPACCLRLFPLLSEALEPLPEPADLAGAAGSWDAGASASQPATGAPSSEEPGWTLSRPARPASRAATSSAGPVVRPGVAPQTESPGRPGSAPPRTPPGVPLRRSRISAPGGHGSQGPAPEPGTIIDIPRPSSVRTEPSRAMPPAPAVPLSEEAAFIQAGQPLPAPVPEPDSPGSGAAAPAPDPASSPAPAETVSPLDQVLENDMLWLLSAFDRAWAEVQQKGGPRHTLIEGLASLVNRALEMAASAAAARGKASEDPEELLLRLIPEHRIAAYIPVAKGKLDVSPLVKHCRELAAARQPVEPVVADAFACLVHALRETLEGTLSLAESASLAAQLRDTSSVFVEMLEREHERLRELAGVSPGSAAIALPPSDTAAQRFMVLRLRSGLPGTAQP